MIKQKQFVFGEWYRMVRIDGYIVEFTLVGGEGDYLVRTLDGRAVPISLLGQHLSIDRIN